MLSGASVDVLCEHNAQVSEGAKRFQVAEAWVSRILFSSLKVDKYSRLFRFPSFFINKIAHGTWLEKPKAKWPISTLS